MLAHAVFPAVMRTERENAIPYHALDRDAQYRLTQSVLCIQTS